MIPKFDEGLAALKHRKNRWPSRLDRTTQSGIRGVAADDQDDLRGCAVLVQQIDEVPVLGHDHDLCSTCGLEDLHVRGSLQVPITNGHTFQREAGTHPWSERWRELIVEPDSHAATIG
jgi:hypothetical protein